MVNLIAVGNGLLPLAYLALLADYGATFFLRHRTHARSPWLPAVVAVHAAWLVLRAVHVGHPPAVDTAEVLSVVALATAAVYALVELAGRDRRTGVFVLALVFVFQYVATLLVARHAVVPASAPAAEASLWGRLHVIPALVAYTALGFAGVYGLLHLAAQRALRRHRFGVLFDRLPPLDLLGRMTWHALLVGFVFMTVAIVTAPMLLGRAEAGDPAAGMTAKVLSKIMTGSVAWGICAAAVLGRWLGRWPPPRVSAIAVAGFLVVMALLTTSGLLS